MKVENLITLKDLCDELKITKSRVNYYHWLGLITPIKKITGNTFVFDKIDVARKLKFIDKEQKKGKTLKEIAEELRKK